MINFLRYFTFDFGWKKNEQLKLLELSLLHNIDDDAFYVFFFQVLRFIISFHFESYEWREYLYQEDK